MAHLTGDDKRRYVAEMFARISPRYDLMNSLMTGGLHHRWKRDTARLTAAGVTGTKRRGTSETGATLDIATGTGDLAFALANCAGVTGVVGVDLLPEMLSIADRRRRAVRQRRDVSIAFVQGDALRLPFSDSTFAGATAGFSLRNMPDVPAAINEMARVVVPGGRVTTLELTPMPPGIPALLGPFLFSPAGAAAGSAGRRRPGRLHLSARQRGLFPHCRRTGQSISAGRAGGRRLPPAGSGRRGPALRRQAGIIRPD